MEQRDRAPYPDEQACLGLLCAFGTPAHVVAHCRAVANVAVRMGAALAERGHPLDLSLIKAAALLHDIARTEQNHEVAGAAYVERAGCSPRVGEIIRTHMNLPEGTHEINEAVVVYLADKLVEEDREVSLERRYAPRIERADGPLKEIIRQKYERAQEVYKMVSEVLSR
ncbi:MAG: HD domain-containing protein [Oscillospiraceae bacterium]|jgi:putative nucleotidyltransferase with HDIG domain